ncbi:hypothetical protein BDD12DRAFT_808613 [Trichophaea hybrida]|nr:hypothetical protein BDD12DRAFT_808613 [Trichophaea hybrida]
MYLQVFLTGHYKPFQHKSFRSQCLDIISQVCGLASGLKDLHEFSIDLEGWKVEFYHRDLKPKNIWIKYWHPADSPVGTWMFSDFGFSTIIDVGDNTGIDDNKEDMEEKIGIGQLQLLLAAVAKSSFPSSKAVTAKRGSSTFGPPELKVSRRSDVWSFGCILSVVLTYILSGTDLVEHFDYFCSRDDDGKECDGYFYRRKIDNTGYGSSQHLCLKDQGCSSISTKAPSLQYVRTLRASASPTNIAPSAFAAFSVDEPIITTTFCSSGDFVAYVSENRVGLCHKPPEQCWTFKKKDLKHPYSDYYLKLKTPHDDPNGIAESTDSASDDTNEIIPQKNGYSQLFSIFISADWFMQAGLMQRRTDGLANVGLIKGNLVPFTRGSFDEAPIICVPTIIPFSLLPGILTLEDGKIRIRKDSNQRDFSYHVGNLTDVVGIVLGHHNQNPELFAITNPPLFL